MVSWPLFTLKEWAPFQLDALGLVTIFGANEMQMAVGNLVHSWASEWLPVLGSYAVANDEIRRPQQGFVLYNITDGIMATDVAAWFTRWLMTYPLTYTATTIRLRMDRKPCPRLRKTCPIIIGASTVGLLLLFAITTGDMWGIANVVSMGVSVLIRQQMVSHLRACIDDTIIGLFKTPGDDVKVFITLPNGKAVTILGPRMLVVDCILTDPQPSNPRFYYLLRVACWGLFGAHAITLGMSSLFNQVLSVLVLLLSTYAKATHVGDYRKNIGNKLRLEVDMGDPHWKRPPVYARLNMSTIEEDSMVHWSMMPQRSNTWWWEKYQRRHVIKNQQIKEQRDSSNESEAIERSSDYGQDGPPNTQGGPPSSEPGVQNISGRPNKHQAHQ